MQREGKKFCSPCGKELIAGAEVRQELLALAKDQFVLPRRAMVDLAFQRAKSLLFRWFSDNWGKMAVRKKKLHYIQEQKEKAANVSRDEPLEITRLRESWRQSSGQLCILAFFDHYWRARDISKDKRRARRTRLKSLSSGEQKKVSSKEKLPRTAKLPRNKLPDVAWMLAEPICDDCEYLERQEYGWECKLQGQLARSLRISRFPVFPSTLADLPPRSYRFLPTHIEFFPKGKTEKVKAKIHHPEWLKEQGYDYENFDNSRQVYLWRQPPRPWKSAEHRQRPQYYLMYPKRDIVELRPGPWLHIVAYGPTLTCVVSKKGSDEKRTTYFQHRAVPIIKEKYQKQRQKPKVPSAILAKMPRLPEEIRPEDNNPSLPLPVLFNAAKTLEARGELSALASKVKVPKTQKVFGRWFSRQAPEIREVIETQAADLNQRSKKPSLRGYFDKKPRQKEGRIVRGILHSETAEIANFLAAYPGRVILLHLKKKIHPKGTLERKKLNRVSANWGDSLFRPLLAYKAELAGLIAKEQEFDVSDLAVCPYCQAEIGNSWQDLVITDGLANAHCQCGRDFNIIWGIAEKALAAVSEDAISEDVVN
jgi:hypothetical protein